MGKFLGIQIGISKAAQPGFRDKHVGLPLSNVELTEKAQIAFKELAQIIDTIAQHGQPLQTRAESKTNDSFGLQSYVADYTRMYWSGAGDFKPFSLMWAAGEHHVDFRRRFGKWEKGWSEPYGQIRRFEECREKMGLYPLERGKGNVVGDPQALD